MIDEQAVARAAQAGPAPTGPAPAGDMAPPAAGGEQQGLQQVAMGMEAVNALIQTQLQAGNPAAQQAQQAFEALMGALGQMSGGNAPSAAPPEPQGPQSLNGNQVAL